MTLLRRGQSRKPKRLSIVKSQDSFLGFKNLSRRRGAAPPPPSDTFPPSAVLVQISIFLCKIYIFPQQTQSLSDFDGSNQFDQFVSQLFPF